MKKVSAILFLILCFAYNTTVSAITYYVSVSGNDAANGLTESTAWKTISKINGGTFSPGDSILFRMGDVWRETLTVPSSGSSGSYIVFTSYGTGAKPRILGSTKAISWSDQGSNVWKSATSVFDPYAGGFSTEIFFEEIDGSVTWGVHKTNTGSLVAEHDWTWASNNVYVYSASDPGSKYTSVEVPQREDGIFLNSKQYIEINGIDIFYQTINGVVETYRTGNLSGYILRNCEIAYNDRKNGDGYGTHVVYNNSLIENNIIHDCGRRGISLQNYGTSNISNIIIQNNILYNGFHTTGVDMSTGSISGATGNLDNVIIRNNLIYDDPKKTGSPSNLVFIANVTDYTGVTTITNVHIYNNIFKGGTVSIMAKQLTDSYIYNNTFYGLSQTVAQPIDISHLNFYTSCRNIAIKNNIFYGNVNYATNSIAPSIVLDAGQSFSDFNVDYNIYYQTDAKQWIILSYAGDNFLMSQWTTYKTTSGWDTHSPAPADPLFISPVDLHVQPGSSAVGAGIAISGVTTDFEGNSYSNPPNIGCYATPVMSNNPVYLSSVVQNATPSLLEMTYNKTLANVVPAATSFSVIVNSVSRTVSNVVISGTKVQLTLSAPVVFGDVVTVSYSKPALNPLQIATGEQAASISLKSVTNNVNSVTPVIPVYVSSAIANATPSILEMTYDQTLTNIVPAVSAFTVRVNSVSRTISSVAVSGTKVLLTLVSPVVYGDIVTVAYTKPRRNPLQTASGGQAITISAQSVTNNVNPVTPVIPLYVSSAIANATPSLL